MKPSSTHACPACRAVIPLGDINVTLDTALCRRCGKATRFSLLCGIEVISASIRAEPSKGVRVRQNLRGGIEITCHRVSRLLFFFIPFTAIWSWGLLGIYGSQHQKGAFKVGESLFGLPFMLVELALLACIVQSLFGQWRISLNQGSGTAFLGVGPLGLTWKFACPRGSVVVIQPSRTKVNGVVQDEICIQSPQGDFSFGASIRNDAKRFIAATMAKVIAKH